MKIFIFVIALTASRLSLACSGGTTNPAANTATANKAPANSIAANNAAAPAKADEIPASVKAALPSAQTFTAMHKELTDAQIASIEKDTGGKVTEKDHHSYPGFSTASGTKTQVGSVTIVKAAGKEIMVIYENKDGSPYIKEIKAEGVPAGFLSQFAGKGHDGRGGEDGPAATQPPPPTHRNLHARRGRRTGRPVGYHCWTVDL